MSEREAIFDEIEQEIIASDAEIKSISELAKKQTEAEAKVEKIEAELKAAKDELRKVQEHELPEALLEAGLSEVRLADGRKITVKDYVRCSIKAEKKAAAYDYLRGIGAAELIKNVVSVQFHKGQDDKAQEAMSELRQAGFLPEQKEEIHWQTLTAFCREQLAQGKNLDADLLGLYVGQKTTIK